MESFGRVMEILVTVIFLFFVPLSYAGAKEDMICQTYVTTETTYFIEAIRNGGFLTKGMYETYLKKLGETNHSYKIELVHYENQAYLESSEENEDRNEEIFKDNLYGIYTSDVLSFLYETEEERYTMKQGDYFMVRVCNQDKTFGTKIQEFLWQHPLEKEQIYVVYGGAIRNEIY